MYNDLKIIMESYKLNAVWKPTKSAWNYDESWPLMKKLTCNWSVVKTVPSRRVTWQESRFREGFLFACCLGEAAGLSAVSPVAPAIDMRWNSLD